jgi:tetratricopeptide (TPR) repeat protein
MPFDQDNKVIELCAQGMNAEGRGKNEEASALFSKAWEIAATDLEKFIAAHYVARHQPDVKRKLEWDEAALGFALAMTDQEVRAFYPSLYLNVAKGYEDLNDKENALKNYQLGLSFTEFLLEDGYGKMIRSGIVSGIERVTSD